jgi:hypothetical protein
MDLKVKQWFIAERAKALAIVLLTRRNDLVVRETKEENGLDCTVDVRTAGHPGKRSFGVYLAAAMTPVNVDAANRQLEAALARVHSLRPIPYPVCVFFFTVKDDQGYYTWAVEPVVTPEGQPKLKTHSEAHCDKLDNEALDGIVTAVIRWYDAFYETMTA